MRILIAHARYAQPGGEEVVVDTQARVLRALGHDVVVFSPDNAHLLRGLVAGSSMIWSRGSRGQVTRLIADVEPDVLHVHNNFHQLSPSIYSVAREAGVPVVQHVHNARLICINAFLMRDGAACNDCVSKRVPWPGIAHRCYRESMTQSAAASAVQLSHRVLGVRGVDLFLPVSNFLATTLVDAGALPVDRVLVCHNAVDPDPGARPDGSDQGYAVFAGRLSREKGVHVLLEAAAQLPAMPIVIAGDGPDALALRAAAPANVSFVGHLDPESLSDLLRGARVTVAPSVGQEPFGNVVTEAMALGVPTIGSRIGAIPELIEDGTTGALVPAGDAGSLGAMLRDAHTNATTWAERGRAARAKFDAHFNAAAFGDRLVAAYESAARNAASRRTA